MHHPILKVFSIEIIICDFMVHLCGCLVRASPLNGSLGSQSRPTSFTADKQPYDLEIYLLRELIKEQYGGNNKYVLKYVERVGSVGEEKRLERFL